MIEADREQEVIKTQDLKELLGELEMDGVSCFMCQYTKSFFFNSLYFSAHTTIQLKYLSYQIGTSIYFHLYQMIPFFRASIEPNFHDLYLKFLDKVNSKALNKEIIQATYENCKV